MFIPHAELYMVKHVFDPTEKVLEPGITCFLSWKSTVKGHAVLVTASEDTLEHVSCTCNIHRYIHAYTLTRTIHICQPLANYTIEWTSNKLQKAKTK